MSVFGLGFLALAGMVFWIWALVDALRRPASQWEAAQQNQVVWIVVILFASIVGAVIYLAVARPQLDAASGIR